MTFESLVASSMRPAPASCAPLDDGSPDVGLFPVADVGGASSMAHAVRAHAVTKMNPAPWAPLFLVLDILHTSKLAPRPFDEFPF